MRSHASSMPSILKRSAIPLLLLSFSAPVAALFDCKDIVASGVPFNLKELGGPRVVHWEDEHSVDAQLLKYNFTLDICNALKRDKGVPAESQCHQGTRICAIREEVDLSGTRNSTILPIEIAGTYTLQGGAHRQIDEKFGLLRDSKSNSDAGKEGFRAELHGGRFPFDDNKKGLDQRAIIEFVCDKDRTGNEGEEKDSGEKDDKDDGGSKDGEDKKDDGEDGGTKEEDKTSRLRERDNDKDKDSASLKFVSYEKEEASKGKEARTLRLEWRTKYACEDAKDDTVSSHWGFFTWFLIILFLAVATYLIFGSWLNYNRYGARGWDLLPHGDTIRDIPFILKDCARRVKDSMQGSGSRGGYSAV